MVGADIEAGVWSLRLPMRADVNLPGPHPWRATMFAVFILKRMLVVHCNS
jgi:hypothetical protein